MSNKVICKNSEVCKHNKICGGAVPHDPRDCEPCPYDRHAVCMTYIDPNDALQNNFIHPYKETESLDKHISRPSPIISYGHMNKPSLFIDQIPETKMVVNGFK